MAKLATAGNVMVPGALSLATTEINLVKAQRDAEGAVLVSDPQQVKSLLDKMSAELTKSEQAWAAYKALPKASAEADLLPQYEQSYSAWKGFIQQAATQAATNSDAGKQAATQLITGQAQPHSTAANAALDSLMGLQNSQGQAAMQASTAAFGAAARLLIAAIAGGIILALGIGVYVARSLANPLKAMASAADAIAEGELEHNIVLERKDEVGRAVASFGRAVVYLRSMAQVADAMAEGDLTQDVAPKSERDVLGTAFKNMITNLRELVGQVQASSTSLAETSQQLGSAANQTGGRGAAGHPGRAERGGRGQRHQPQCAADVRGRRPARAGHRRDRPRGQRAGPPDAGGQRHGDADGGRRRAGRAERHGGGHRPPAEQGRGRARPARRRRHDGGHGRHPGRGRPGGGQGAGSWEAGRAHRRRGRDDRRHRRADEPAGAERRDRSSTGR
jgi:HAMP domain-containing protein